jgi:arsenite methyltransferase
MMKKSLALLGLIALPGLLLAQDSTGRDMHEMHRLHQDPKAYIAMLEDPQRDEYQKPHQVIAALELKEGEIVADLGAGSGYFTFRLAHHVGSKGRVYAVDVNPDMVLHLNRRIRDSQVNNVITILAPPDDPLLPDGSIDRFFICDTWHHIENHSRYLARLKKVETPVGPPMEMRIKRDDLVAEMEANGLRLDAEHTFLPYQYFLVFKAKP